MTHYHRVGVGTPEDLVRQLRHDSTIIQLMLEQIRQQAANDDSVSLLHAHNGAWDAYRDGVVAGIYTARIDYVEAHWRFRHAFMRWWLDTNPASANQPFRSTSGVLQWLNQNRSWQEATELLEDYLVTVVQEIHNHEYPDE